MGFLDFLKPGTHVDAGFTKLFDEIVAEANGRKANEYATFTAYGSLESFKALSSADEETQRKFLSHLFSIIEKSWKEKSRTGIYSSKANWRHGLKLIPTLLRTFKLTDDDLLATAKGIKKLRDIEVYQYEIPGRNVVETIEVAVRKKGLTPKLKEALKVLEERLNDYSTSEQRKENELIHFLLHGDPTIEVSEHDRLGRHVISMLRGLDEPKRSAWIKLFAATKETGTKSVPSQKWIKAAQPLVSEIGQEQYSTTMQEWLELLKGMLQEIHKSRDGRYDFLRDENHEIMKGLIWCCGLINDPVLHVALDHYAALAYKKKPGVGPISAKTGTAAMFAFSLLPVKEGVSRLSKFRMKIKNRTILKSIDKLIQSVSEKNGMGMDEIEEISVPDFGIKAGLYTLQLDGCTAQYSLITEEITFVREGKAQKSVPADVKQKFDKELKLFKSIIKEIQSLLPVIKGRLEQSYLRQRSWRFNDWVALYVDHPLSSLLAKRLIWHFSRGERKDQGILAGEKFVNAKGQTVDWLDDQVSVQLWHPIGFAEEEIVAWRNFLDSRSIVQPFKQAYREIYIITDAELRTATYSNRFAAHVLRQHQFAALCRQRGWSYQLMGNWDSHNTPYIDLPRWEMAVEFYVNADWQDTPGNVNGMGIFNYITTDQVRFGRRGQPIALHEVPALLFSEIMRDVDLFVGVTSIGNDPAWQDGGDNFQNTYWREYSFSDLTESAKIRSQVLQMLVPKLKIAPQCSFDKKFLIVKGKIRTYKIHMGSGNILMEPNDQYLCIVPDGRHKASEKVFLPFEGDGLLSIILSKAFLLAADDKITDKTITRQIKT